MDRFRNNTNMRHSVTAAGAFLLVLAMECAMLGVYRDLAIKSKPCCSIPSKLPGLYYVSCPNNFTIISSTTNVTWNHELIATNLEFLRHCIVAQNCNNELSEQELKNGHCQYRIRGPNITLCFDAHKGLSGATVQQGQSVVKLLFEDLVMLYTHLIYVTA